MEGRRSRLGALGPPWTGDHQFVAAVSLMVLSVLLGAGFDPRKPVSGTIRADTELTAGMGVEVYAEDFLAPGGNWPIGRLDDGPFAQYSPADGYVVSLPHTGQRHAIPSLFGSGLEQSAAMLTASQLEEGSGVGFGLGCDRGSGGLQGYEFTVYARGAWSIDWRWAFNQLTNLSGGTLPRLRIRDETDIEVICATLPDRVSTRLALFINGELVSDVVDREMGLRSGGWFQTIVLEDGATLSKVGLLSLDLRDLGR